MYYIYYEIPKIVTCIMRFLVCIIFCNACLFLFLPACKQPLNAIDYNEYLCDPRHGLVKDFAKDSLRITCSYKPKESIFTGLDTANTGKNIYCILTLSIKGQQVENNFLQNQYLYSQCINYLSNNFYTDVVLCTNHDTIPASASLYARQYATTKASSILVVFSNEKISLTNGFDIIYQADKFGAGPVRFSFTADAINRIPALGY